MKAFAKKKADFAAVRCANCIYAGAPCAQVAQQEPQIRKCCNEHSFANWRYVKPDDYCPYGEVKK